MIDLYNLGVVCADVTFFWGFVGLVGIVKNYEILDELW